MSNQLQSRNSEWQLSSAERQSHREWIIGRCLTLLSHYWRDDDPVELTAAIGRDWADVLEGLPQEYIQRAAIKFQQQYDRRKPTPAAIYAIARDLMPPPFLVVNAALEPEPYSALSVPVEERRASAEAILREAGYSPKRFGGSDDE